MTSVVALNTGPGRKGPATDASFYTEMIKRRTMYLGVAVKAGLTGTISGETKTLLSDRPMQRGFTDGVVTPRLNLRGAYLGFANHTS